MILYDGLVSSCRIEDFVCTIEKQRKYIDDVCIPVYSNVFVTSWEDLMFRILNCFMWEVCFCLQYDITSHSLIITVNFYFYGSVSVCVITG